jgi:hypothetical protein
VTTVVLVLEYLKVYTNWVVIKERDCLLFVFWKADCPPWTNMFDKRDRPLSQ